MLCADLLDLDAAIYLPARAGQAAEDSEGRDLRRIAEPVDPRPDRVGDQLSAPVDAQRLSELHVAFDLEAVIFRFGLAVLVHGEIIVLDLAGGRLEDEIGIAAV